MKSAILVGVASALGAESSLNLGANPVRKVVTLLQNLAEKVEAEGKREEELYEKYKCYCKTTDAEVSKSVEETNERIPQLEATIKEASSSKSQLQQELKDHKADRSEGQQSLAKANSLRDKERAQFEKDSSDAKTNVAALGKAVKAIESNIAGSAFLQTSEGGVLKNLLETSTSINDDDRTSIVSFLTTGSSSGGSSSEIVGILKTIQEETQKDLDELVAEEETRVKGHAELSAGKQKEIASATAMIESKTERVGVLAVKVSESKDDYDESQKTLSSDQEFLIVLRKGCKAQDDAIVVRKKTRSEEQLAIADTIKVLNDDDSLDLFKKTLPSPEVSLIQMHGTTKAVQKRALNLMHRLPTHSIPLSLIELSLKSKKVDFSKVNQLIDDLVVVLKNEQVDDDKHKTYCEAEFDSSDDKKKATERAIANSESQKAETEGAIEALAAEIVALKAGIAALDKGVASATEQRKEEHAEFKKTESENSAALNLIEFAKNRMQKFYNPKLYKPPAPQELSEEDRIYQASGGEVTTVAPGGIAGTGISALQGRPAPPPAPIAGDYKKGNSGGVVALMDNLANDLRKQIQEAEFEEKDAQEEYESLMADSKKKRASDAEAITVKETAKAGADESLQKTVDSLEVSQEELKAVNEAISNLHGSCDFLVQNYDARKQARAQEIDGLAKSKSVLAGANYSLEQTQSTGFLSKQ